MIKVVYTYRTKTADLPELMGKFAQSADSKFASTPNNTKIEMFRRVANDMNSDNTGNDTMIVLDIYYDSVADFEARHAFEQNNAEWQKIWFSPDIKHTEVSVEVFEVITYNAI